ncbi:MAG: hypothetical protein ACR2H6_10465 [Pyrinomonadaceae bacterium]
MIIRTKHIQPFIVATLLIVLPSVALASESRPWHSAGCSRIDSSRSAQFISYEGVSAGASYSDVVLRLRNNSDCPLIIETDDHEAFVLRGEKNVALHYLLHDRRRQTLKPAYGWGDSVFTVEIRGGDSVLFRVPLVHFNRRFDVAVPFKFGWDGNHVGAGAVGGVAHFVYFFFDDVPTKNPRRKQP